MWSYERRLQYPVNIKQTNPDLALAIITQLGGPDGELGASMRYISQRYTMPDRRVAGVLTDIGTEAEEMIPLCLQRRNEEIYEIFKAILHYCCSCIFRRNFKPLDPSPHSSKYIWTAGHAFGSVCKDY